MSIASPDPAPLPNEGPKSALSVFEILMREHAEMLRAYLHGLLGGDPIVDDLFQEVMLVAWRRLDDYDRARPFAPWLRGIAQILVMEHARKGRARPATTDPEVLAEVAQRFEALDHGAGDTFGERAARVWECVAKLPEAMREAIELVYVRRLSFAAAAESVGASREAFGKRVQRGRRLLAECMGIEEASP